MKETMFLHAFCGCYVVDTLWVLCSGHSVGAMWWAPCGCYVVGTLWVLCDGHPVGAMWWAPCGCYVVGTRKVGDDS